LADCFSEGLDALVKLIAKTDNAKTDNADLLESVSFAFSNLTMDNSPSIVRWTF